MEVLHNDEDLERLENDPDAKSPHGATILRKFRYYLRLLRDADDERDIRSMVGPKNFYKLDHNRSHQHAMRLNNQWRLILEFKKGNPKTVVVVQIIDYHKG